MIDRIRVEVQDQEGNTRVMTVPTLDTYSPAHQKAARELIGHTIDILAEDLGRHPDTIAHYLVTELVERHHDAIAYEREAQRRGVLPL